MCDPGRRVSEIVSVVFFLCEWTTDAGWGGSFDIDLPTECDDEYWINDNPELAFKQPRGKPSIVAFFNCIIRLGRLHAFALQTIVSFKTYIFCESRLPMRLTVLAGVCQTSFGSAMGTTSCVGTRFRTEQVHRLCPRTPYVITERF